jgi:hypothetical protein
MATEKREFEHKGHKFEMRLEETLGGLTLYTFLDGRPVRLTYSTSLEANEGWRDQHGTPFTEELFDTAQADIEEDKFVFVQEGESHGVHIRARVPAMPLSVLNPLTRAYNATSVGGVGFIKPEEDQTLEAFQNVLVAVDSWCIEGKIEVLGEPHRESQTTHKYVDLIKFKRLR